MDDSYLSTDPAPLSSWNSTKTARIATSGCVKVGVLIAEGAAAEARTVSIRLLLEEIGEDIEKGTSCGCFPELPVQHFRKSIVSDWLCCSFNFLSDDLNRSQIFC